MYALHTGAMPVAEERISKALRMAGRVTALLLGFALVIGAVVSLRFALYEYGHGDARLVRDLFGALVPGPGQTSR